MIGFVRVLCYKIRAAMVRQHHAALTNTIKERSHG